MTKTTFYSIAKTFIPGVALVLVIVALWGTFADVAESAFEKKDNSNVIVTTETKVITDRMIVRRLDKIGEMATYKYDYHGMATLESSKKLFNHNVPFTKHTIDIMYEGIIKAGIKVEDIGVEVNNDKMEIQISLPKVEVFDNYIDMDNLISREDNNILNPIQADEISDYMIEVEKQELSNAISEGLYDMAKDNAEDLICNLLEPYEDIGYEILFDSNISQLNGSVW